jgi:hypothetical protein
MRQWLLKQRTKPKHVRDNIAFGFASGAAVLALAGWLLFIPKGDVLHSNVADESSPEAFSTFFSQIKQQVAGVRESLKEPATSTPTVASSTGFNPSASSTEFSSTAASSNKEAILYVVSSTSPSAGTSTAPATY